jgi:hypothetical protein
MTSPRPEPLVPKKIAEGICYTAHRFYVIDTLVTPQDRGAGNSVGRMLEPFADWLKERGYPFRQGEDLPTGITRIVGAILETVAVHMSHGVDGDLQLLTEQVLVLRQFKQELDEAWNRRIGPGQWPIVGIDKHFAYYDKVLEAIVMVNENEGWSFVSSLPGKHPQSCDPEGLGTMRYRSGVIIRGTFKGTRPHGVVEVSGNAFSQAALEALKANDYLNLQPSAATKWTFKLTFAEHGILVPIANEIPLTNMDIGEVSYRGGVRFDYGTGIVSPHGRGCLVFKVPALEDGEPVYSCLTHEWSWNDGTATPTQVFPDGRAN